MAYQTLRKKMLAFTALLLAICMAGCVFDSSGEMDSQFGGDTQVGDDILITIKIPGSEMPTTRSIAGDNGESVVKNVSILVFEDGGQGNPEQLAEHALGEIMHQGKENTDEYKVQFKTKLAVNTEATTLVIIANVSPEFVKGISVIGKSKPEILEMLEFSSSNHWNVNPNAYTPIPMYGEKVLDTKGVYFGMKIVNIALIRMLARIDVENKDKDFELSKVFLLNYSQTGYIAPAWDTSDGKLLDPQYKGNPMIPNTNVAQTGIGKALEYNYTGSGLLGEIYTFEAIKASGNEGDASFTNAICLIIQGKRTGDTKDNFYRIDFTAGKDANDNAPKTPGFNPATVDYMPVYRNHRYYFEISEVNGPGYEDIESAYKSLGIMSNLKTYLHVVDINDVKDIVFNGEHYLGVGDFANFTNSEGHANVLVSTNYAYGWSVKKITYKSGGSDWLSAVKEGAENAKNSNLSLSVEENDSGENREAIVHITAGRLEYQLIVIQEGYQQLKIKVFKYENNQKGEEISSLDFIANGNQQVDEQSFIVEWQPKGATIEIDVFTNSYQSEFVYFNGSDQITAGTYSDPTGSRIYTIKPGSLASNNPFYEQGLTASFSITLNGETEKAKLDVRHYNRNAVVEKDDFYLLDGSNNHNYTVKSNVEWKAYYIRQEVISGVNKQFINSMGGKAVLMDNSASPILVGSGGHNLATGGTRIDFSVIDEINKADGPETYLGEGHIRIVSGNEASNPKYFADFNETLLCGSVMPKGNANCYIVAPGEAIGIPVFGQAQRAMSDGLLGSGWITSGMDLKAHLLWCDNSDVDAVVNTSTLKIIKSSSSESTLMTVITGKKTGNAVVAVYNDINKNGNYDGADEIKWSWHIWVTDYDPDMKKNGTTHTYAGAAFTKGIYQGREIMDRNLGATWTGGTPTIPTNATDAKKTYGLMYQWGRKDPFPGAEQLYNASGNTTSIKTEPIPSGTSNNLPKAVNEPMTYITYDGNIWGSQDWYSNGILNHNLWCQDGLNHTEGSKTAYDPCPAGWRVPMGGATEANNPWAGFTSTNFVLSTYGRSYTGNNTNAWYPASGFRDRAYKLTEVGLKGHSWGSTRSGKSSYTNNTLYFTNNHVDTKGNYSGSLAIPVRCIKDKQ